ncbi:transcription cofactor vestigial-like protein 1 isoform X1 [Ictalurus punctatus]|uniref:Transcription cofactor vestigial-like protein 1 isoform X1 n=1 Tax=Ictalurus punctatus TaxID=7998 RepID=A0A2D0RFA9_ICTPU|nr:transcription cofactor vestigial-like protein 1 isoform X1 [Ictalurus punctatus]
MAHQPGSPVVGKTEEQSGSLLLTYFQGDINSMVDAHFSRALENINKPKRDITKNKKPRKSVKSEQPSTCNWDMSSHMCFEPTASSGQIELGSHEELLTNPRLPLNTPDSSSAWHGGPRQGTSLVLPPMVYPSAVSAEGLMVADHQYNSLLNLLHSDRPELGSVMVSSSKQELIPGWTRHPGFGDQMTPDHSLDSGVPMMEKKDLYWY